MRAVDDDRESNGSGPVVIKGLRIATKCVTVEQFVENYHQICESSAIFIPNTQRPVETVLQFRFDLHDGSPALLGVGIVVEELTTKHNRFDHVGIVVKLQRLSRASAITFDQMLAARTRTLDAPAPVYPRAITVPAERMTTTPHQTLRQVPIPLPTAVLPSSTTRPSLTRAKTAIGLPALAKKPTDTVRIPAIIAPPTRKQALAIPTEQPAERPPLEPKPPAVLTPAPSSIDDGWDSIASTIHETKPEPVPHAPLGAARPVAAVADIDLASAPVDQKLESTPTDMIAPNDVATPLRDVVACAAGPDPDPDPDPFDTVTAVEGVDMIAANDIATPLRDVVACAAGPDPDPFDTVTAVDGPDGVLLASMRGGDGRAAPVIIEAAVGPSAPASLAISEPMGPIVDDRPTPAVMAPTLAPPPITLATFPTIDAPSASIEAPIAMPAIDHAALARVPVGARRPWRWLAAAAFAVLLCATVAATVFDRPPTSVPPPSTFAPTHESPSAVATARDQAPTVAADPKTPVRKTAPAVAKSKTRASSIERPSPRPVPATRSPSRPAARKKCKALDCL